MVAAIVYRQLHMFALAAAILATGNRIFAWLALATGILLLVPLALQLIVGTGVDGTGFNWRLSDFAVMGTLIYVTGSAFVLAARRSARKYWLALGIAFALAFLLVWAELAVGI